MSFQRDSQPESLDTEPKQTPSQARCFQHDSAFTAIVASGFSSESSSEHLASFTVSGRMSNLGIPQLSLPSRIGTKPFPECKAFDLR